MEKINKSSIYIAIGMLIVGFALGALFFSGDHQKATRDQEGYTEHNEWTCAMHSHIRQSEPGQCPICRMDLVPVNELIALDNPLAINMSPTAMQLANVETSVISRENPVKHLRMNGRVKADERLLFSQSSHIPGRIERLLVSVTGEEVKKGQVLAYIYSPELVTALEELREAYKIRTTQPDLYQAARGKLINWKLTNNQIDNFIKNETSYELFPVHADVSGVIMNKHVNLGDYIKREETLFEVADLSRTWVLFDVYESDLPWVKKGDRISFTISSFPGQEFEGKISFIDPIINAQTRVATARVELANNGLKLKPDMFASGIINSPMSIDSDALVIPKTAVMWTGKRSVVYVKNSSLTGISFVMREITLGPEMGDSYVVLDGLLDGEELVTNGTFSIDAAAQLAGKPSMMNPEGIRQALNDVETDSQKNINAIAISDNAKETLTSLFNHYLNMKDALVADDYEASQDFAKALQAAIVQIDSKVFRGTAGEIWNQKSIIIQQALKNELSSQDIEEFRHFFQIVSDQFVILATTFGPFEEVLFIQHCPMANDNKGADWISKETKVQNPYYGSSMLTCGEVTQTIKK